MSESKSSGGIGFFGLLGIVFITLKLTDVIGWSWWLVLLPIYGIPVVLIVVGIIAFFVAGVLAFIERCSVKRRADNLVRRHQKDTSKYN